jgi:predicted membrane protein
MDTYRIQARKGGVIAALVLIMLGSLFLLAENGVVNWQDIWRFWPMALIVAGITKLFRRSGDCIVAGLMTIGIGILIELAEFGYIHIRAGQFWPAVLIGMGVFLLWRALRPRPVIQAAGSKELDSGELFTIFGGGERRITHPAFERAEVLTVCGGYKIDLRKAVMKDNQAVVEATAVFGGVEMIVPEAWNVNLEGAAIFGGYSDETHHPDVHVNPLAVNAPQLFVRGIAVFGGVVVKN